MADDSERQYHLKVGPGDVAETVLLPGDPDRVDAVLDCWRDGRPDRLATDRQRDADGSTADGSGPDGEASDPQVVASNREYRTATGRYGGQSLSVTSTGIGGPSAAIAVEELARVGAETLIRVGSCGAVQPGASVGDLVITTGCVRLEGTGEDYVRPEYPAVADRAVVGALVTAAERLGHDYRVGITATAGSFHGGQGRASAGGYRARDGEAFLERLRETGVENVEMEAATVLTLASLFDLRSGAVCTVYADRHGGEFHAEGDRRAIETASEAVAVLAEMDRARRAAGADRWHPGLGLSD